jgi:ribose transport system substrate-binding protein
MRGSQSRIRNRRSVLLCCACAQVVSPDCGARDFVLFGATRIRNHGWPKKLLRAVSLSLVATSGCARLSSKTVFVIPATTAQELWEGEHAGVATAALGGAWKIHWNGPIREDDIEGQINLVQDATDAHAAGIILSPDHAIALTTVVRRAISQDIPVVIVGSPLPMLEEAKLHQILNDDAEGGREAADRLGQVLEGNGDIALLGFDPNIVSTMQVAKAFEDNLRAHFPHIRVVARHKGSFRLGEAEQQSEEIIRSFSQLDGIFAIGTTSTRAAYIALKNSGRMKTVKLIGCDQDLDLMYYVRSGEIDSMVAQNTPQMGYLAMQAIQAHSAGKSSPLMIRVQPVLVTRENIDRPEIQKVLTMNWRPR